jgi:hypothetical protein
MATVAISRSRNWNLDEAMSGANERLTYAGLTSAIVCAGLLCRWPALGLPWSVAKYAGSALWGAMVYAALRTINPRGAVLGTTMVASAIAICVEFFRLYHQPGLDAFRTTLAGQLLLGRIFSLWNVVAYAVGITCVAMADGMVLPGARRRKSSDVSERRTLGRSG